MDINDLIGVLVEQNKSFIEQNKLYRDMLCWAVGSIITILVIFLTANFFTMRKFREDEIEKIKTAVILDMKNNSLSKLEKELLESVDLSIGTKMSKVSTVESKLKTLEKRHLQTTGELRELEGDFYYKNSNYTNAFEHYLQAGNKYLEASKSGGGYIDALLRRLERSAVGLNRVLSEISDFNKFASQLSPEFQNQVSKINEILRTKETL